MLKSAAKYMDLKLRSGNKEQSDEELDKTMDNVITLFRFVHGVIIEFTKFFNALIYRQGCLRGVLQERPCQTIVTGAKCFR
jgi:hypothetical protein